MDASTDSTRIKDTVRTLQFLAILLVTATLGACAHQPPEPQSEVASAQAELYRAYMYTLDKRAREGFTQIQWIHPPTNAQVAQKVDRESRDGR